MKKEAQIVISGRIQGVRFRQYIYDHAVESGLKGNVENMTDGNVIVTVQGEKANIDKLLSYILKAPFPIDISGFKYDIKNIEKEYESFEIVKQSNVIKDQFESMKNFGKNILNIPKSNRVPVHVAFIPDGNRRWARGHGLQESMGHRKGGDFDRLYKLFQDSKSIGIKFLSVWAFSTENWKRDKNEVNLIFKVIKDLIIKAKKFTNEDGIKVRVFGNREGLPKDLLDEIAETEEITKNNNKLNFIVLLNYGGRDEIVRVVNRIIESGVKKVDEAIFSSFLDTSGIPDPDLIIRTSGEQRTSGLYPWQGVYSELYFTPTLFPDFDTDDFKLALDSYNSRDRRMGGSTPVKK